MKVTVQDFHFFILCLIAALVMAGPNQYPAIIAGVWGYNGFLSAGCAVFFLELSWKSILLVGLNTVSATAIQVILIPVFSAVSQVTRLLSYRVIHIQILSNSILTDE